MTTTLATDTAPLTGDALRSRYDQITRRIGEAAARSGRKASQVVLVAVSKTASMEQIRELVQAGHVHFGENRVQQLQQRVAQIEEFQARRRELSGASSMRRSPRTTRVGALRARGACATRSGVRASSASTRTRCSSGRRAASRRAFTAGPCVAPCPNGARRLLE